MKIEFSASEGKSILPKLLNYSSNYNKNTHFL